LWLLLLQHKAGMKRTIATAWMFWVCIAMGIAQTDSLDKEKGFSFMPLKHNTGFSINPDNPCIRLANVGSKWKNMVGSSIPIVQYSFKGHTIVAQVSGYVELFDISKDQIMSWQLWRGNLGADFYYYPRLKNKKATLGIGLMFHHESQHVTDIWSFYDEFLWPGYFDNGSARSFEYRGLDVQYTIEHKKIPLQWFNRALVRFFPQPLLEEATRQQTSAYAFETGLRYKVHKRGGWVYGNAYYEQVNNQFTTTHNLYRGNWNKQPFLYRMYEVGYWMQSTKTDRSMNFFFTWGQSNGRGLNFLKIYKDVGGGIRFNI
jgi:hypothetical protein